MNAWKRVLKIRFKQQTDKPNAKVIEFGSNQYPHEDMWIKVRVNKYIGVAKDNALITIKNLTYNEIINIMNNKFYSVEIICGYENSNIFTVFKGNVLRISNTLNENRTNTFNILCGSSLISRFSQNLLNYNLKSGINVYSALKFMSRMSGMNESKINISKQFAKQFLQENQSTNNTIGSFLNGVNDKNPYYIFNTDESNGSMLTVFDASKSNNRVINIKNTDFIQGYPQLNSEGLTFSILPTINLMAGDVVRLDNAFINLENVTSINNLTSQSGVYLDENGCYMILSLNYNLCNRDSEFSVNINAKARSLISNYIGVK